MRTDFGDGPVENTSDYSEIYSPAPELIQKREITAASVRAILHKARATIGPLARPYFSRPAPWSASPAAELDLETSLEDDPHLKELWVDEKHHKRAEIIVCLDTSLSMTGKKLAMTAVSLAVLTLQLDPEDLAIIAFESEAQVVKPLGDTSTPFAILEKFLRQPARGLTNISAGLELALAEATRGKLKRQSVILITDGRYTAGDNPESWAKRLPRLHVVHTGNPWASPRFCRRLAKLGRGKYVRVADFEELPKALYSLVQGLTR